MKVNKDVFNLSIEKSFNLHIMSKKILISEKQLQNALMNSSSSPSQISKQVDAVSNNGLTFPSWLVGLLKVLGYAIGIILAGVGTTAVASTVYPF